MISGQSVTGEVISSRLKLSNHVMYEGFFFFFVRLNLFIFFNPVQPSSWTSGN